MTLKTRWFGKKVKGESLKNLISALGENPEKLLQTSEPNWDTRDADGRVGFTPTSEGVNVDLYIFRQDYCKVESNNIPSDSDEVISFGDALNKYIAKPFEAHIKGEIKYQNKENKL